MSASAIVPLTVTYAPSGAATTTVTVLGQVLNNGGTNWIPTGTSDNAIYLATTSEADASQTVLDGTTYYLSTGPAVPAQVTITPSVSASASASGSTSGTAAGETSSSASMESGPTTSMTNASPSMSTSAAASSSSTGAASMMSVNCASAGRMGLILGFLCYIAV